MTRLPSRHDLFRRMSSLLLAGTMSGLVGCQHMPCNREPRCEECSTEIGTIARSAAYSTMDPSAFGAPYAFSYPHRAGQSPTPPGAPRAAYPHADPSPNGPFPSGPYQVPPHGPYFPSDPSGNSPLHQAPHFETPLIEEAPFPIEQAGGTCYCQRCQREATELQRLSLRIDELEVLLRESRLTIDTLNAALARSNANVTQLQGELQAQRSEMEQLRRSMHQQHLRDLDALSELAASVDRLLLESRSLGQPEEE